MQMKLFNIVQGLCCLLSVAHSTCRHCFPVRSGQACLQACRSCLVIADGGHKSSLQAVKASGVLCVQCQSETAVCIRTATCYIRSTIYPVLQLWQWQARALQTITKLAAGEASFTLSCSASWPHQDRPQQGPNSTVCLPTSPFVELLPAHLLTVNRLCLVLAVQQHRVADSELVLRNEEGCPVGPAIAGDLKLCLLVIQVCQL